MLAGAVYVVSDVHGDLRSAKKVWKQIQKEDSQATVVFNGDYVNNGLRSIDTLRFALELQRDHPKRVVLMAGNHETCETFQTAARELFDTHWTNATKHPTGRPPETAYGHLRLELVERYGFETADWLYETFGKWGATCAPGQ